MYHDVGQPEFFALRFAKHSDNPLKYNNKADPQISVHRLKRLSSPRQLSVGAPDWPTTPYPHRGLGSAPQLG